MVVKYMLTVETILLVKGCEIQLLMAKIIAEIFYNNRNEPYLPAVK